jgi:iron(III) transport system ATP-binding protein
MSEPRENPVVHVKDVQKHFAASSRQETEVKALQRVSFSLQSGEFYVLLGASGSGKTTLLRCVAGLEKPDEGEISIDGKPVFSSSRHIYVPPENRPLAMVFQSYALWPHMSVFKNIAFPLRYGSHRLRGEDLKRRVHEVVELMGLTEQIQRPVTRLSGGQQQRVALARALALEPHVLLMDEPLSNLDAKLRAQLRIELKQLTRRIGITTLYVTHDQMEAMVLGDRMAVMDHGQIIQQGSPWDLYKRPDNVFVAQFLGDMNLLEGTLESLDDPFGRVWTETGAIKAIPFGGVKQGPVRIGIRLEDIALASGPGENVMTGRVVDRHFLGEAFLYHIQVGNTVLRLRKTETGEILEPGQEIWLYLPPDRCLAFISDKSKDTH